MEKMMAANPDAEVIRMANGASSVARETDADLEVIHMVNAHTARNRAARAERRKVLEQMNEHRPAAAPNTARQLRSLGWFGIGILFLGAAQWGLMENWMGIMLAAVCSVRAVVALWERRRAAGA